MNTSVFITIFLGLYRLWPWKVVDKVPGKQQIILYGAHGLWNQRWTFKPNGIIQISGCTLQPQWNDEKNVTMARCLPPSSDMQQIWSTHEAWLQL